MMKRLLLLVAIVNLGASLVAACAQTTPTPPPQTAKAANVAPQPTRTVKGRVLVSKEMPAVSLEFDEKFKYAGGHSFVLYDVANAEQHFFVDADKEGRVRRLYWVQFEGYLPSNTHAYDYKGTKTVNVGGLEFIADAQARQIPPPSADLATQPANKISDGDHARAFLASKGFRLASDQALWQRLVHMVDASKRDELMIIYLEDLSGMGLTAADLAEGGRAAARWDEISKGLLERAVRGLKITR
jgi:hypothetical protein